MAVNEQVAIYIGWDGREAVASDVCKHSILRRTKLPNIDIQYLKHRDLRAQGMFRRPWTIDADTGNYRDAIDSKPFSTEFSHTRFLVPALAKYKGWALFLDSDMIFQSDIKDLFALCDDRYAVMCVKHQHHPAQNIMKMDGRAQLQYYRKNWSSFVLWNCSHSSNRGLTPEKVNFMLGSDLHAFSWLDDELIGSLPFRYNYISGISPKMPMDGNKPQVPFVIHYTEGGPWFDTCKEVPYAELWTHEYEEWQREAEHGVIQIPATKFDRIDPPVRNK